jgi:hypothetical protein
MTSWEFTGKRVEGSVKTIDLFGQAMTNNPFAPNGKLKDQISRHHIIDIQLLQAVWNTAVKRNDADTMVALATWAGAASMVPSTRPLIMDGSPGTAPQPQGLLKKIAWNPFNLTVGPLTNYRPDDPGDHFDDVRFQDLPKFALNEASKKAEALARLEWNEHIQLLKKIDHFMKLYILTPFPQDVTSLQTNLKSCVPSKYKHINNGSVAKECLLHPALWHSFTLDSDGSFLELDNAKKTKNALAKGMIPYVAKAWLPEPDVKPVDQFTSIEDRSPGGLKDPADTIAGGEKDLLDRPKCTAALAGRIKKLEKFAKNAGLRVHVSGPQKDPYRQTIIANVAASCLDLNQKQGYKLIYASPLFKDLEKTEVRIYMR